MSDRASVVNISSTPAIDRPDYTLWTVGPHTIECPSYYKITGLLGTGGFGVVAEAIDMRPMMPGPKNADVEMDGGSGDAGAGATTAARPPTRVAIKKVRSGAIR